MTTKRVALYARVSTLNHGQDPEVQLRELREFCHRRRFEIVVEYVDKGISGSRERRPSLDKLMTACRKRLVDAVVVYRYDRFARSLRQLVNALEEFRRWGSTSSACTKEWTPQLPTVASYSESSPQLQSLSGN
jgi:DNA invertase Pin-like site-specific DNA recombinase